MIITGGVGENRGVELISPSGNVSCLLPNMPDGGRKEHTYDHDLICGGTLGLGTQDLLGFSSDVSFTCLNLTSSGWVETNHSLYDWFTSPLGIYRHSSWAVKDGIILMGGYDNPFLTTELVKFDGTNEKAFDLKYSATR